MEKVRKIEMYLQEGTLDGIVVAKYVDDDITAVRLPRVKLDGCTYKRLLGGGIFFLFERPSDAKPSCVGQSDRVMESLRQHLRDERYWSHAVVFVKGGWSKTTRARLAGRLGAVTKHPRHTPEKIERLAPEEDVETVLSLLSTMNFQIVRLPTAKPKRIVQSSHDVVYVCESSRGASARGIQTPSGFTVLEGSRIAGSITRSFDDNGSGYYDLRNRLIATGVIEDCRFTRDYTFDSRSAASSVVLGTSSSGNADWRTEAGQSYRRYHRV